MELDYGLIGKRVAQKRRSLKLTQAQVAESSEITEQYLSNIERAVSIPSVEVIMRLALALDTTPDTFLVGTAQLEGDDAWRGVAELLRGMSDRQLDLARTFLIWLGDQRL